MNNDNLPEKTRTLDGDNRMTRRQFSSTNTRASDNCENFGTNHPNERNINTRTDSSGTFVGKCVSSLFTVAESFFPLFFGDCKPDSASTKTTYMSTHTRQEPDGGYSNVHQVQPFAEPRPAPCGAENDPVDTINVFHQPQLNIGLPQPKPDNLNSPLETDGPQSELPTDGPQGELPTDCSQGEIPSGGLHGEIPSNGPELNSFSGSTLSEFSPSITPSASSNSVSSSNGDMKDFVVLHTDDDLGEALKFREHICTDAGDHNITVDLFSETGLGKTNFRRSDALHNRYRYILICVTMCLLNDDHRIFLNEKVLTSGLKGTRDKKERVIPVWFSSSCYEECELIELELLGGLDYYRRNSETHMHYVNQLNNTVLEARSKFPVSL